MKLRPLSLQVADVYRAVIYACTGLLLVLPFLEKFNVLESSQYTPAAALILVFFLAKLSRLPNYDRRLQLDAKTGLLTRDGFLHVITEAIDANKNNKLAVILLNINNFSGINHSIGYECGDKFLQHVADKLTKLTSSKDSVARVGVDEFGILLTSAAIGYPTFCDRLYEELNCVSLDGLDLTFGISAGVSVFPQSGKDAATLLRTASIALRQSRSNKSGYVIFKDTMERLSNLPIMAALKQAAAKNEFVLHYQPQFSTKTSKICGVEALIRWNHPTMGLLYPDVFIDPAEQSNQISLITAWSIKEGVRQISRLRDLGYDISLSINLSSFTLYSGDILVELTREIACSSIPYKSLTLELSESSFIKDFETLSKTVSCLGLLGVQISIDGFGAGNGSLLLLKHIPIKEIKLHKTFIENLDNSTDLSIVKAIIELAHTVGSSVVADGVETHVRRGILTKLGCDVVQGFELAKPMVESELIDLLEIVNGRQ